MITVSIIVPAYNEERTICEVLRSVAAQKHESVSYEVVVVDDGSVDHTVSVLEAEPALYSKLIKLPKNGGKGSAVIAGLEAATGDYILFQDADLEYDPRDYRKLFEPILHLDADLVMGSRMVAPQITRVSYFWHKVGNFVITFLFNIMNNTTFTDVYSCYLLYRRNLVDVRSLCTRGWEQHAEILSLALRNSKRVYEVPINYFGRTYEEGKKIRARHAFSVIACIVHTRLFRRTV
jgi:glycosyltransferase involved in cell wall biosynthesis